MLSDPCSNIDHGSLSVSSCSVATARERWWTTTREWRATECEKFGPPSLTATNSRSADVSASAVFVQEWKWKKMAVQAFVSDEVGSSWQLMISRDLWPAWPVTYDPWLTSNDRSILTGHDYYILPVCFAVCIWSTLYAVPKPLYIVQYISSVVAKPEVENVT